ncbi:hypothetical protein A9R01_15855 ['Osedax' symbiont bacterium Rs2_46_30_T18]|nr:hypothetical protein A9R01_15855 ['Osedax' symbiont bacterium Rs2_46_30_T18]
MNKIAWIAIGAGLLTQPLSANELFFEATAKVSTEVSLFAQQGQFDNQNYRSNLSVALEPEFFWEWNDASDNLTFKPFFRIDQRDSNRSHADIRELSWVHLADDWELRTGFRKVFWGVTEYQNLVDVINQSDTVEGLSKGEKLGQPMLNLSLVRDWGIVDLFVLPGFREQTYVGNDGRFRSSLVVDEDSTSYQSSKGKKHVDVAARWSHSFDLYDVGLHWYKGTNRAPQYQVISKDGTDVLKANYQQMEQVGIDAQATIDNWLLKSEVIYQDNPTDNYFASQMGFEYTYYGIQESAADLGILMEYGYDQRGKKASALLQNDIGVGARLALNDTQSSSVLVGMIHDLDYNSNSFSIEADRRIGENWKATLRARVFSADDKDDVVSNFTKDDYVKLIFDRYF